MFIKRISQISIVLFGMLVITLICVFYIHEYVKKAPLNFSPVWSHKTPEGISGVCISPDGKVIVSSSGKVPEDKLSFDKGEIKIWDMNTGRLIQTVYEGDDPAWAVAVSKDGSTLACGIGERVEIWRLSQGIFIRTIQIPKSVSALEFSPDGRFLAGKDRNNIYMWNAKSGRVIWQKLEDTTYIPENPRVRDDWSTRQRNTDLQRWLHFSPDGKHLAVPVIHWENGSDLRSKVELLNSFNGKLHCVNEQVKALQTGCYSNDGTLLAIGGVDEIIVLKANDLSIIRSLKWDLPPLSARQIREIGEGIAPIPITKSIAFTKYDNKIAIAPYEGDPQIQIDSVLTGTGINIFIKTRRTDHVSNPVIAFSPSGNELAVAGWGMVSLYRVDEYVK